MKLIEYSIEQEPKAEDDQVIRSGLAAFNKEFLLELATHFSVFAKDNKKIIAGALIYERRDALYIDTFWCGPSYRKNGIGSKIIEMIDNVAREKQLSKIFVDTFAFQAETFYQKHGFYCIGVIPEYMLGHDRLFLRKDITHGIS